MQRGGGQGTESAHKSNSLGGSTASGITGASSKANLSHLSLLGQQLNSSFSSSSQKQQPHQQPNLLNLNSGDSMNFPLAMQGHGQHFPQGQQQQQPSSQAQSSVVDSGDASGFSGMQQQNVNALAVPSQGFSGGSQQFLGQQQAQSVESFMTALNTIKEKITQLQACVPYMSQSSQVPNGSTLQVQQQVQQQAAAAISQIAQVAANMFQTGPQQQSAHQAPHQPPRPASHPAPHQSLHQAPHQNPHQPPHQNSHQPAHQNPHQPPHQNPHQPPHPNNPNQQQHAQQQTPVQNQVQSQPQQHHNTQSQHHTQPQHHTHMSQSSPQQQQQPQSHQQTISMPPHSQPFFGVSQGQQSFNFFQGGSGNSASSNGYGNPQGVGANTSGVSMDLPNASSGLPSQMVDGGVPANATAGTGSGMNVAPKGASGGGSGGFGAANQNLGGTNGPNVSSAMVSLSGRQGSPLRSQVAGGGGMGSRGGSNSDISHLTGARPSIPASSIVRASTPMVEERDDIVGSRDDDDDGDNEALAPGSYDLVELDAIEILAEHTHFCEMCGKGFKRDANLRMHMRGHGDEYKTPAALARPDKASHELSAVRQRRYSCPYGGCKRNKKHRKFQPLKTMLCVKNHYRRSHCPKILTCNKCKTKKFSVVADLKTHEKHCGCDKWQCSCGTTFSRKDKLIGHIGLFVGHKAAFGDMDATSAMDGVEMTPANPPSGQNAGSSGGSGYALSAAGNMSAGSQPNVGCGSGMGLNETSMQGLSSRGNTQGGSSLTMPKDGSVLVPDNSSSSDSFPSAGLSFPNLFSTSFSADQ